MSIQSFDKDIIETKGGIDYFKKAIVSNFHEQSLSTIEVLIEKLRTQMKESKSLKTHTIEKKGSSRK